MDITNEIKIKGCELCGYKNTSLLRFFEFDHIDPKTKIDCVAIMIKKAYTIDDLIKECAKCRVLCGHCHRIHTRNQVRNGIITRSDKPYTLNEYEY
jgi:hypothetical protein